jgi:hypothetical protein
MEQPRPAPPVANQPSAEAAAPAAEAPASSAPRVVVKRDGADFRASWVPFQVLLGLGVAGLIVAWTVGLPPEAGGEDIWELRMGLTAGALSVGLGCLVHAFLVHPLFVLSRAVRAETARLRAALACPYCRDGIQEDEAMACDRPGCGAIYHGECWREVRPTYGGCAVWGCGSPAAHAVGKFAIQRRLLRLVVAAALFPPQAVRRLRQTDARTFRDLWQEARAWQHGVSRDGRALVAGLVDAMIVIPPTLALVQGLLNSPRSFGLQSRWGNPDYTLILWAVMGVSLLGALLAVACIRLPLLAAFGMGVMRLVARMFKDELAALSRADEGTFLARLAGGLGKKAE